MVVDESVQSKVRVKMDYFIEWSRCKKVETWEKYKKNETKKLVSEARTQDLDGLYQSLVKFGSREDDVGPNV